MFHKNLMVPAFAALALVVCLAGTTPACAANCAKEDMAGRVFTNSCIGTAVRITEGTGEVCQHSVRDGDGGVHLHYTIAFHAEGVDEDGNNYVVDYRNPLNANGRYNDSGDGSGNYAIPVNLIFVGKGNAPKFRCKVVAVATTNANGVVSVQFEKDSEGCECIW